MLLAVLSLLRNRDSLAEFAEKLKSWREEDGEAHSPVISCTTNVPVIKLRREPLRLPPPGRI